MKNVLLLGNGIDRAYDSHAVSWTKLLEKMTTVKDLPKHETLPFPLEVVLRTDDHVDEALVKYSRELYGSVEDEELRCVLAKVLGMGFDEILTTNYDYALEGTAIYPKKVTDGWLRKSMKHTGEVARAENTYLLHTYQEAAMDGAADGGAGCAAAGGAAGMADCRAAGAANAVVNRIWHIHGDARRPGSIVIGHYMYVNLVSKWREKLKDRAEKYKAWEQARRLYEATAVSSGEKAVKHVPASPEEPSGSWLDAFVLGNVYILGLGMDFSELDLWWLLNRKKREKVSHGKVVFYEPEPPESAAKYALLRAYGVEVRHLNYQLLPFVESDSCDDDLKAVLDEQNREISAFNKTVYADFYKDAIKDIEIEMKG